MYLSEDRQTTKVSYCIPTFSSQYKYKVGFDCSWAKVDIGNSPPPSLLNILNIREASRVGRGASWELQKEGVEELQKCRYCGIQLLRPQSNQCFKVIDTVSSKQRGSSSGVHSIYHYCA